MKTAEFKSHLDKLLAAQRRQVENQKKERQSLATQITATKMVADNITDIVPKGWVMNVASWGAHIDLVPPKGTGIDVIDYHAGRLARQLNVEPKKNVTQNEIIITYYLFPSFETRQGWRTNVAVTIYTGNSEKCDVEVVEEMQPVKKTVLTGYCKVLAETKYLKGDV
jgi:hypothetical protein